MIMGTDLMQTAGQFLARRGGGEFPHVSELEVNQLIGQARTEPTRLLIKLLWHTGARISEILDLKLADLDFEKNTITLRRRKRRKVFEQKIPTTGYIGRPHP